MGDSGLCGKLDRVLRPQDWPVGWSSFTRNTCKEVPGGDKASQRITCSPFATALFHHGWLPSPHPDKTRLHSLMQPMPSPFLLTLGILKLRFCPPLILSGSRLLYCISQHTRWLILSYCSPIPTNTPQLPLNTALGLLYYFLGTMLLMTKSVLGTQIPLLMGELLLDNSALIVWPRQ